MNIKLLQIDLETNDKYILFGIDKFYEFAIEKSKLDNLKIKFVFDFINKNICSKDYSLDDFISSLNKIGRCKLCKNDYEILAKKSHLIPKFLYKNIIKNKDKPIDKFIYKVKEKKVFDPKKISPDGYFENDIFCINCEKIFKYLEDYFSSVVFNKLKNKLTPFREEIFRNNLRCIKFTNFDNKKFKLFLLSILWRLSVSKKIEFVGLNLGRYEDEIGSLIQKNLESESFGYLSINTFDNFNWLKDIIFLPSQLKNNIYGSYYKMVFGPYIFLVNISIKNLDELFNENSGSVNYLYDLPNNITQEDFLSDSFLFRFKNSIELKF